MPDRQDYLKELKTTFDACLAIAESKNSDYATDEDPLANFRLSETMANIAIEKGIYIRMLDKVSRIGQLIDGKMPEVTDEKMEDTLMDLINYTAIMIYTLKNSAN